MPTTPTTPGVERIRAKAAELSWTVAPVHPTLSPDDLRITRGAVAVFVYRDRAGQITEAARHEHGDPVGNVNHGAKLRAVLAWLGAEPVAEKTCAQCGSPKSSPRHITDPNRPGHAFVAQPDPDTVPACEDQEDDEPEPLQCSIFGHEPGPAAWRCGACGARIAHAVAELPGGWCRCGLLADDGIHVRPAIGPAPGSFHDPRVGCCDRDAADCDCPPQTCERCGGRFTEDDAGADPAAGLCPSCSASNADRVTV